MFNSVNNLLLYLKKACILDLLLLMLLLLMTAKFILPGVSISELGTFTGGIAGLYVVVRGTEEFNNWKNRQVLTEKARIAGEALTYLEDYHSNLISLIDAAVHYNHDEWGRLFYSHQKELLRPFSNQVKRLANKELINKASEYKELQIHLAGDKRILSDSGANFKGEDRANASKSFYGSRESLEEKNNELEKILVEICLFQTVNHEGCCRCFHQLEDR